MSGTVKKDEAKKAKFIVTKDDGVNVSNVSFPSDVQVGLAGSGFDSNLVVQGDLTVHGSSGFDSNLVVQGDLTVHGNAKGTGFNTVAVSGQSSATSGIDENTLTLVAGSNMTITTSGNAVTLAAAGGGGGSSAGIDDQTDSNDDQLTITDTAIIINEDSDDLDFRVESNGKTSAFLIDGATEQVAILSDGLNASNSYKDNVSATGRALPSDIGLYVSGAIGGKGTTTGDASKGTSVFAGDVAISGSLWPLTTPGFIYLCDTFYLNGSPTGDPTSDFYVKWNDGLMTSNDAEAGGQNNYWKYFPYGGEIVQVTANGDGAGNFSEANIFVQDLVFAMYTWTDAFVSDADPHKAGVVGHMTASSSNLFAIQGGSSYKHKALYNFTDATINGSFIIPPGQVAALAVKGEGTQRKGFTAINVHVTYKQGLK